MKKSSTLLKVSLLAGIFAMGCITQASAQTVNVTNEVAAVMPAFTSDKTLSDGLQIIWDNVAASTNFAVALGGGRGIKGDKNLAFVDYVYNISDHVGAVLGYDAIRAGGSTTYSFVKGGLQLKAEIAPLKNFGFPTFKVTPFTALLIDSNAGHVGQVIVAGASHRWTLSKNWGLNVGGFYENRSGGNTTTDGVYLCGFLAASRNF